MDNSGKSSEFTRSIYNKNSRFYNLFEFPMEYLFYRRWCKKLMKNVKGKLILEAGIGTGKNIEFYASYKKVIGIDLSEGMLKYSKKKLKEQNIFLVQADVQHLPFKQNVFDSALSTFVFCSVPNPVKGLNEIKRTLKNDIGFLYLLEHVLPENKILAIIFKKFNKFSLKFGGVNINRKTGKNIKSAGFETIKEIRLFGSIFKLFINKPSNKN